MKKSYNPHAWFSWSDLRTCGVQVLIVLGIFFSLFFALYLILRI